MSDVVIPTVILSSSLMGSTPLITDTRKAPNSREASDQNVPRSSDVVVLDMWLEYTMGV